MSKKIEIITDVEMEAELAEHQARILKAKIEIEESKKRLKELTANKPKVRSRIIRGKPKKTIRITERLLDELKILYHHRVADTEVFQAVIKGNKDAIRNGLTDVFDNGYMNRPKVQWMIHKVYSGGQGRSVNIYTLADKGMAKLQEIRGFDPRATNDKLGDTTLFHDLMLTRVWACLKRGLEEKRKQTKDRYNLLSWYQDQVDREQLKMEVNHPKFKKSVVVIPDSACVLQCPHSRYLFFWEYYRTPKGGHKTHLDKLRLYNLIYKQNLFQKFGVKKGFRVITITPKRETAQNLIKLINTTERYKYLQNYRFWFVSEEDFRIYKREPNKQILDVESILKPIFLTPYDDSLHSLEE